MKKIPFYCWKKAAEQQKNEARVRTEKCLPTASCLDGGTEPCSFSWDRPHQGILKVKANSFAVTGNLQKVHRNLSACAFLHALSAAISFSNIGVLKLRQREEGKINKKNKKGFSGELTAKRNRYGR